MATQTRSALEEWALKYAEQGWLVSPIHRFSSGRCGCGDPDCTSPGKHPVAGGVQATTDPAAIRQAFAVERGGVQIRTGTVSNLTSIDVDPRHGGHQSLARFELEHGFAPETRVQFSGGGIEQDDGDGGREWVPGRHYLFPHVAGLPSGPIPGYPGLEVLNDGKGFNAEPTQHAKTSRRYRWMNPTAPVLSMPDAWIAAIQKQHAEQKKQQRARGPLPEEIAAGERHDVLYRHACRLRAYGANERTILTELQKVYAERCAQSPPIGKRELASIAKSAVKHEAGTARPPDPALLAVVDELAGLVDGLRWPKISGATQRECLLAILSLARRIRSLSVGLSYRQLAELANIGDRAALRALMQLRSAGWLAVETPSSGTKATVYRIQRPASLQTDTTHTLRAPNPLLGAGDASGDASASGVELQHDALRWGKGAGKNARKVLAVLDATPRTAPAVAELAGLRRETVWRLLERKLSRGDLVVQDIATGGWCRTATTLDDAARQLGTAGKLGAMRRQHHKDRAARQDRPRLYQAVWRFPGISLSDRRALIVQLKRWTGDCPTDERADEIVSNLWSRMQGAAGRRVVLEPVVDDAPRQAARCRVRGKSASTPPPAEERRRLRRPPPRRRLPDNCTELDAIGWQLVWNRDDYTDAWADAEFLRDPAVVAEARADLVRLERERAALERRRRVLLEPRAA